MSQQQVQRLQTLLETVQRNRQRPGEPMNTAAAQVVQKKSPANTAEPARARVATPDLASAQRPSAAEPARARIPTPDLASAQRPSAAEPSRPRVSAPEVPAPQAKPAAPAPRPAAAQPPATQPKSAPRIPEPQPAAPEPIVPRMIEPDAPRPATRPIAQLVSKHAPVVDATFGAMLKRSLSLRPH
jgi:hypothetical protein